MRKMSELLKICSQFHFGWGGRHVAMCIAAREAHELNLISDDELGIVRDFCENMVMLIDDDFCHLLY